MPEYPTGLVTEFTTALSATDWPTGTRSAGVSVSGGKLLVPATYAGGTVYNWCESRTEAWSGKTLIFRLAALPAGDANAQMWVEDSSAGEVDRLGFEYVGAAGRMDFIGQTGVNYAPVGTTVSVTNWAAQGHSWFRLEHTGTSVIWSTSPDGLTWTVRRTLASGVPAWTSTATCRVAFEAFRNSAGTTDSLQVESINVVPTPPQNALIWAADYTQATNVAAGYNASGSQRQNGAGQFNDTTVPWPITITNGPGSMGRAIPFTIPDNYRRYEQVPAHETFGPGDPARYFGWSFHLDASFPLETPPDYQVIEQLHQAWGSWSPPVAFEAMNNALYLTGGNGLIRSISATDPLNTWSHFQKLLDITTGRTYRIVYYIDQWSTQPNTSKITVWVDDVLVLDQYTLPCPTNVQGDAADNETYRKTGFYHRETIHGGTIWHAGATLATTYEAASGGSSPIVPEVPNPAPSGTGRARVNACPNPALAVDATGWTSANAAGVLSRVAVTGMDRPYAIRCTQTAEPFAQTIVWAPSAPAQPDQRWSATLQFRVLDTPKADAEFYVQFVYIGSGGALLAGGVGSPVKPVSGTVYRRSVAAGAAPAGTAACAVRLVVGSTTGTAMLEGTRVDITAARVEQIVDPYLPYADGDTVGWSWDGTAGATASRNPRALGPVRYNLIPNPALATSATGWTMVSTAGPSPTAARAAVTGMDRPFAYRATLTGASQGHTASLRSPMLPVGELRSWSATLQARFSAMPTGAWIGLHWYDSSGNALTQPQRQSVLALVAAGVPFRAQYGNQAAPAAAASFRFGLEWDAQVAALTVDVTAVRFEVAADLGAQGTSTVAYPYADGDTPGWTWDGTAGSSASRSVAEQPRILGAAVSPESARPVTRKHRRNVNVATTEVDTALPIGSVRTGSRARPAVQALTAVGRSYSF